MHGIPSKIALAPLRHVAIFLLSLGPDPEPNTIS